MSDLPKKISAKAPRVAAVSMAEFQDIVEGAKSPEPPGPMVFAPSEEGAGNDEPAKPALPPSQMKSMTAGRGRPKKNVKRPWEGLPTTPGARMTLILDPRDKARLDFLQHTYDRPAQRFLRSYIEQALREDAEKAFLQMYPDAGPPEEDD